VSDSRISGLRSDSREIAGSLSDQAQKVFACENEPHIFGYSGWADYSVIALSELVDVIDAGNFFMPNDSPRCRQAKVHLWLRNRLLRHHGGGPPIPFSIAHGLREGVVMHSRFHLWIMEWTPIRGWNTKKKYMRGESVLLYSTGSGRTRLRTRDQAWKDSEIGKKSRGVYGAFCEALRSGADPQSKGPPQLVGLFDRGNGRYFGVLYCEHLYLKGRRIERNIPPSYQWFNETFEVIDPQSKRLAKNRQRQPPPKTLSRARKRKSIF
jgi:hypothetical protein